MGEDAGRGRAAVGGRRFPPTLKRLGQHFLADRKVLLATADALELTGTETVIEVGPGRGALTDILVERAGRVIAVELDRALAALLRERYSGRANVEIIEGDILHADLPRLAGGPYVLAGNVPYYITTPIIFHSLAPPPPLRSVFLVQLEVARRMRAAPGSGDYGALSVTLQASAAVELLFRVPPSAFRPPPRVDSAVVRLRPLAAPIVEGELVEPYRRLVQASFGLRRKQMRRVMRTVRGLDAAAAGAVLSAAGIDPDARPETLSPADFASLLAELRG